MSSKRQINRRSFVRQAFAAGAGLAAAGALPGSARTQATTPAPEAAEPARIKKYRPLGRTGFLASDISSGGPGNEAVLRALLQAGVNYIDTAESYGRGQSEAVTGRVVREFERKKIYVTTKLAVRPADTKETILGRARKSLERLQMDQVDCLMMHMPDTVALTKSAAFHEAAGQLKAEGRVRHLGISQHGGQWQDVPETMEQVALAAVADGRFDLLLFVYNFVQQAPGRAILAACRERKVGATLMKVNPVGGYLEMKAEVEAMEKESKPVPDYLKRLLPRLKEKADAAEGFIGRLGLAGAAQVRDAAVRFALAHPDVGSVCVSFNNFDDVKNHLALSGTALTEADAAKLAQWLESCGPLYCRHACGLCQGGCPRGVPVNTIMRFHHYFAAQGRERHAMEEYRGLRAPKPDGCAGCAGHCESACPYGVPIQGLLAVAHRRLTLA